MTIYPFVLQLGPLEITGYGLMMMVAFLMGGWLIALELKRRGLAEDYAADMVAAAVIGGIIGAKLWYVAVTQDMRRAVLARRAGLVRRVHRRHRGGDPQRLASQGPAPLDHAAGRARACRRPTRSGGSAASW